MMPEYRETECLVIKKHKYTETSAIIEAFSRDGGKASFLAKGIYRKNGSFESPMESLSVNNIEYFFKPEREMHTLTKSKLSFYPENIVKSVKKYEIAGKVLKILRKSNYIVHTSSEIFDASYLFLNEMNNTDSSSFPYFRFLLKYSKIEGIYGKRMFDGKYSYLFENLKNNDPVENEDTEKLIDFLEKKVKEHME